MHVDFTEQVLMKPELVLPKGCETMRCYRQEIFTEGYRYPIEMGELYLPADVDIMDVIKACNGSRKVYADC